MSFHKLLHIQVTKYLPEVLIEHPDIQKLLNSINESYMAYDRDRDLTDRAFKISEKEYLDINILLKHEVEIKKQSIEKLKEAIETITGETIGNDTDDRERDHDHGQRIDCWRNA